MNRNGLGKIRICLALCLALLVCGLFGCDGGSGGCDQGPVCGECPQWAPPAPDWCSDGTIIPGEFDECGCQGPPTCIQGPEDASDQPIVNGSRFLDTDGNVMHTHGGSLLRAGGYFYWYGEHRYADYLSRGISCYRSVDLVNWGYRGDILTDGSHPELRPSYMERPKVIHNALTNRYVLWFHWENGQHYGEARAAVAYGDAPDAPFTYQGSFRPLAETGFDDPGDGATHADGSPSRPGYMSRDCTLFVDDDGTAYFISAWNENASLNLYRLTADYRRIDALVGPLFAGQKREAPCLFKRDGYYYLITSGCTGWDPNQGKWAYSRNLARGWSALMNFGDATTYRSQPAYVYAIQGSGATSYLYAGDRWGPAWGASVADSQYVWLPIRFDSATAIALDWYDRVTVNARTGEINGFSDDAAIADGRIYTVTNRETGKVLEVKGQSIQDGAVVDQWGANGGTHQQWRLARVDDTYYKLVNVNSGKLLDIAGNATQNGADAVQMRDTGQYSQQWQLIGAGDGCYKLYNRAAGKILGVENGAGADGAAVELWSDGGWTSQHWQLSRM